MKPNWCNKVNLWIYVLSYRLVGRWDDKMSIPRPTGPFKKVNLVKWIRDDWQVPLIKSIWSNAYAMYEDLQMPIKRESGQMSIRWPTGAFKTWIWTNEYTTTYRPLKMSIWSNECTMYEDVQMPIKRESGKNEYKMTYRRP